MLEKRLCSTLIFIFPAPSVFTWGGGGTLPFPIFLDPPLERDLSRGYKDLLFDSTAGPSGTTGFEPLFTCHVWGHHIRPKGLNLAVKCFHGVTGTQQRGGGAGVEETGPYCVTPRTLPETKSIDHNVVSLRAVPQIKSLT